MREAILYFAYWYTVVIVIRHEIEAAKVLLEGGANPNMKDKLGRTPLIIAASKGKTGAIELLVKYPNVNLDAQVQL